MPEPISTSAVNTGQAVQYCGPGKFLEGRLLATGTINLRLGAVWRLAYEAADWWAC